MAVILTPLLFTAVHLLAGGFDIAWALKLYSYGAVFTMVRIVAGSIEYSIVIHTLVNVMVLLPQWFVAIFFCCPRVVE